MMRPFSYLGSQEVLPKARSMDYVMRCISIVFAIGMSPERKGISMGNSKRFGHRRIKCISGFLSKVVAKPVIEVDEAVVGPT